ncbi:unnamed protein product [Leuciscus chuanchicus]
MQTYTHTHTHTPFLKDTSTCGGILAELISPPRSLCLLGGYSTSRSFVCLTVGFTVCLPSNRKRHENAMSSPTYIPITHFLKNTSLYCDLCCEITGDRTVVGWASSAGTMKRKKKFSAILRKGPLAASVGSGSDPESSINLDL